VIALPRTSSRRILLAIAFSAVVHAAILWLPHFHLPHARVQLPPLTARLEALPEPVAQAAAKPEPTRLLSQSGEGPLAMQAAKTVPAMKAMEKSSAPRPFPKHVQLSFSVYGGENAAGVGELIHQMEVRGDSYELKATRQITGASGLLHNDHLTLVSVGKIGAQGLQPTIYKEEKITATGRQELKSTFDWAGHKLRFSNGQESVLPDDAQDRLSFMYQIAQLLQLSAPIEFFPLSISDGRQLDALLIEIGANEKIDTPMGELQALHLRKVHEPNEAYFEIWLALEYRLLPVKFRQLDSSGAVLDEYVIADIRAAEE